MFTSDLVGIAGNTITVHMRNPGTPNATLGVVVTGTAVVINLATGATSLVTSTIAQVRSAVTASVEANALLSTLTAIGSLSANLAPATAAPVALTGGAAEPFPLNTPVLLTGPRAAAGLGATGTLKAAYDAIYAQGVSTAVVVRVTATSQPALKSRPGTQGVSGCCPSPFARGIA